MRRVRMSGMGVAAVLLALGGSASAQTPPAPAAAPGPAAPAPVDPAAWWSAPDYRQDDVFDPLGNRRWSKRDAEVRRGFTNGVDASLYRLWGLQPLQSLSLRRGESIFEMWFRPTDSTRQAVVRIILRADGETFLQARAGRGCCSPEIARRVDVNVQLTGEQRRALGGLRDDPVWDQPRNVVVSEGEAVVSSVCVDGASYDLTLVTDRRAKHLRRSCDPAEIGSIAGPIRAMVEAARGHDPRFDIVFAQQRIDRYAQSYAQLREVGGTLQPAPQEAGTAAPPPPPADAPDPRDEAEQAILEADRAFAARASAVSAAQAFREFMEADEGLLFRPNGEPVRGAEAIYRHFGGAAPETGKLTWEPVAAWASESGDFGASWGRSRFTPSDGARPAEAHRYITVWRRDASGRWKGLMDMGAPAQDLLRPAIPSPSAPAASGGATR